jgi:hypothetical protein
LVEEKRGKAFRGLDLPVQEQLEVDDEKEEWETENYIGIFKIVLDIDCWSLPLLYLLHGMPSKLSSSVSEVQNGKVVQQSDITIPSSTQMPVCSSTFEQTL